VAPGAPAAHTPAVAPSTATTPAAAPAAAAAAAAEQAGQQQPQPAQAPEQPQEQQQLGVSQLNPFIWDLQNSVVQHIRHYLLSGADPQQAMLVCWLSGGWVAAPLLLWLLQLGPGCALRPRPTT
jgi:hypothetical protein